MAIVRPASTLKTGLITLASTVLLEVGCLKAIANSRHQTKLSAAILIMFMFPMALLPLVVGVSLVIGSGCLAIYQTLRKRGDLSTKITS
ncbi:MAG TPA: hypothetical protein VNV82_19915 [Bryobacteraceae bacterium]|jgi:ABC-type spermidine/putrescine transport system permease subunit II|nr:hypothetical protein [Bryobacteraceae bacterium]